MLRTIFAAALAGVLVVTGLAIAGDSNDKCLKAGDPIGPFYVTKVSGPEDNVKSGQTLCYRCKYGSRPMVMVFARETEGKVAELVKQLDAAVAKHEDAELKSFVTLIGGETDALRATAEKMAKKAGVKNVPITVAEDNENGPSNYKLDPKAEVIVVIAKDSEVKAQHTFKAAEIDVAAVMKEVKGLLN
jgi:hypothetical protein